MITIINIKTVIMEKIEDRFYRNKWQPPDRDVEIVLTKKFCEDLKTQTRHRLCVSLALVLISYIILVAGTAFTFIFGLSAQTQSAIMILHWFRVYLGHLKDVLGQQYVTLIMTSGD
jgi:hypothetical protein